MTKPDQLKDNDKASQDAILGASPELATVAASVRAFAAMMNERRGRKLLESWMAGALATGEPALRSFVTGLRADQDAVTNGLSLQWSSGLSSGELRYPPCDAGLSFPHPAAWHADHARKAGSPAGCPRQVRGDQQRPGSWLKRVQAIRTACRGGQQVMTVVANDSGES
jgi:hypothetical protein